MCAPWVKDQDNADLKHVRAEKMAHNLYQVFYFSWATYYGFITLVDAPWFPKELGGNGTWDKMKEDAPFVPQFPGTIDYAML